MVILSPQGRAVAAIALGFALVTGNLNSLLFSVLALFGDSFPDGRPGIVLFTAIAAVIALGVLVLARQAAGAEGWAGAVGQGAGVLVLVYLLMLGISLLGGLVHGEDNFGLGFGLFPGFLNMFGGGVRLAG